MEKVGLWVLVEVDQKAEIEFFIKNFNGQRIIKQ